MKKLSKKLVLSSLSLGLAVVTLSTTTYAWYTNNTSVSADGIQGTTDAGASAGLLISNAYAGTYSNSVTLTTADYTVDGSKMIPLEYKAGTGLVERAGTAAVTAASKGYLQFSVFVKATSDTDTSTAVPVYLKSLTITNAETGDLPLFDVIKTYTDGFGADATYAVDAAQALNVAVAAQSLSAAPANKATTVGTGAYSVNALVGTAKNKNLGTAADAVTYYNTVMEPTTALVRPTDYVTELTSKTAGAATASNAITVASIADANVYELTFTIWLDGWDQYCFDACKGQTFNISLALTTDLADVVVGK